MGKAETRQAEKEMSKLNVKYMNRDKLIPYANNARTHSEHQIKQIAASIQEFGFTNPILIDEDNGIIAGHGRLEAAEILDLTDIPTIKLSGLSDAQKRAYVIADNKLAMNAGWDAELLKLELTQLSDEDFKLELLGFDDTELVPLIGNVDGDEFPSLPDGDREPFQQMTFILHDEQASTVVECLSIAKSQGPFIGENTNSNGNALDRICVDYIARNG
jgi:ParB-like chromosome segregation protein Spo0J